VGGGDASRKLNGESVFFVIIASRRGEINVDAGKSQRLALAVTGARIQGLDPTRIAGRKAGVVRRREDIAVSPGFFTARVASAWFSK